ncbi:MAG: aminopeptidase P family N-terminal domain-containing protein, partial [Hyphomicrobium sp.]
MFQTFSVGSDPSLAHERVKRLRALLGEADLAALLVPRGDEHQGEYVAPSSERLCWLTSFSGSAGLAVIAKRQAAVFVDGRYTVQVQAECDAELFEFPGLARATLMTWLTSKLKRGDTLGFDPWLHTVGEIKRLEEALRPAGIKLKATPRNLVDRIWGKERPKPPLEPVLPHAMKYAGRAADIKIATVQKKLKDAGQDAVILTNPDSICWLFNIRGRDVAHNPITLAFAILPVQGKPELFVADEKLTREARSHLDGVVRLAAPDALKERVASLRKAGKRVRLDPERAAWWFGRALGKSFTAGGDPIIPLKAVKNAAEIKGAG